ncbi:hypothetical protein D3C75_1254910 [compost metagenome]
MLADIRPAIAEDRHQERKQSDQPDQQQQFSSDPSRQLSCTEIMEQHSGVIHQIE